MAPKRKKAKHAAVHTSIEDDKEEEEEEEEVDRISSLPDTMLLEILSFLDLKHAVQTTTLLSKRWRYLWISLGKLTFNTSQFYSPTDRKFVGFHDFVDQALLHRDNSDINTFSVTNISRDCDISSRLYAWILSAVRRNVKQLCIDVWGDGITVPYSALFTCKTLTKLKLWMGGTGNWSITLPDSMCLPNLLILELCSVSFEDENLTNKFFLSCPNLEELNLEDVGFVEMNVKISCLKLKRFTVDNGYCRWSGSKFKLHAPGLSYFSCIDYMSKDYIMDNLSSLVKADFNVKVEEEDQYPGPYSKLPPNKKKMFAKRMMQCLGALRLVEDLKLSAWFLEVVSASPDLLKSKPTKLCYLTSLRLKTWLSVDNIRTIAYLLKISPNIKSLFMEISQVDSQNKEDYLEAEMSFQCLLDKLEIVELQGAVGCANELNFLEVLLKNANVLKKLVVCTSTEPSPDRQKQLRRFSEKLLMFPRASNISIVFV